MAGVGVVLGAGFQVVLPVVVVVLGFVVVTPSPELVAELVDEVL